MDPVLLIGSGGSGMACAAIASETVLVALGVGFGLGGLVGIFLAFLLFTPPHRRKAARPLPDQLRSHPRQGALADPDRGPGQEDIEIGPERLRQLLDQSAVTGHHPPVPRAPAEPSGDYVLTSRLDAAVR